MGLASVGISANIRESLVDLRLLPLGQFGHGVAVVQLAVLVHIVAGDDVFKAFGVVLGDSALHHFPALRHMLGNPPGGVEITG